MIDITRTPLFAGLSTEDIARAESAFVRRHFAKGAPILVEGQESDGLYVIGSGSVKVFRLHEDGREKTLAVLRPGEVLGEMSLFGGELRSASAAAAEQTTMLVIVGAEFRRLLVDIPTLAIRMIETLSERLRQANQQIQELSFMSSRSRVVCRLVRLAQAQEHSKVPGEGILLAVTHAELARMAATSRETATKVLKELSDKELVRIGNRKMWVLDLDSLCEQIPPF